MVHLGILLVLLSFLQSGFCNDCQPGFADTCFTDVSHDLQYMLNLKAMVAKNVSSAAVHELCLAIDDSLNCTSDIIDGDCANTAGKRRFDSWLLALRGAYDFVCQGKEHEPLKMILQATPCWSIEDFVLCCEEHLGLRHIGNLLHTEIDNEECKKLHQEMRFCSKIATVGDCREQEEVEEEIDDMISEFFWASDCRIRGVAMANAMSSTLSFSTLLMFSLWLL